MKIITGCGAAFGAMHLLLSFGGMPSGYVVRFVVAATVFGFLFPYLILRVRNGLAFSYTVYWIYYAIPVAMPKIFSSYSA